MMGALAFVRRRIGRHPFSGKREWKSQTARERDAWIETARHYAQGQDYWRERAEQAEQGARVGGG